METPSFICRFGTGMLSLGAERSWHQIVVCRRILPELIRATQYRFPPGSDIEAAFIALSTRPQKWLDAGDVAERSWTNKKRKHEFMPISQKLKGLIKCAWEDGAPCLVATQGPNGPNISPKGSMVVFDDEHLAYWERSKKQALDNLGHDKRVCVIYANFKAQRDGVLELGFLRFYGRAELHQDGPIHDAIFKMLLPREQTHVGADTGIGVLVKIDRAADVRGKPLP
jgi:hypothetical protein